MRCIMISNNFEDDYIERNSIDDKSMFLNLAALKENDVVHVRQSNAKKISLSTRYSLDEVVFNIDRVNFKFSGEGTFVIKNIGLIHTGLKNKCIRYELILSPTRRKSKKHFADPFEFNIRNYNSLLGDAIDTIKQTTAMV